MVLVPNEDDNDDRWLIRKKRKKIKLFICLITPLQNYIDGTNSSSDINISDGGLS